MVEGRVDRNFEAFIELDLVLDDRVERERFLVDTGFNGFVAVSRSLADRHGLIVTDTQQGVTADGNESYFDVVWLTILWHEMPMRIQAQVLDEPLIGSRLLRGSRIQADWIPDGLIQVTPLDESGSESP
ncbi:clan AA aspartic protease [Rhodopirellula europaea]|uniref:clan AA aspartic protease n=1 Tax=Rhodopirellula europaea TaxID=1263866 RepID=UPI003D2D9CB7|tara:strand:- start:1482 stop:1868 length:387 start_codon:yes stop_codon:yes gene_type:complete